MTNAQAALIASASENGGKSRNEEEILKRALRYKEWLDAIDRDYQRQSGSPRRPRIDEAGD